jgi:hypothetical protein
MAATLAPPATRVDGARGLARAEWAAYFDELSRRDDLWVTLHVHGGPTGGTRAERLPLVSITYEDGGDRVAIAVGGRGDRSPAVLWHHVDHPRLVFASQHGDEPAALSIIAYDGTRTVLRFSDPDPSDEEGGRCPVC